MDGHGHHHHQHARDNERRTLGALALTASFMFVEVVGGLLSGSLALLADAAHMLTDALALALAWGAFRLGRKGADSLRSYGYRRAEVLAALVNGLVILALVGWIVWEAVSRILAPRPILGLPMLAVAATGLVVNLVVLRILHGGHDSLNLRAAALHVMGDLLGSVAAILGAIVILLTGWTPIDPLLSLVVALLIVFGAVRLLRSAFHILLEGAPEGFDEEQLREGLLAAVPGLEDVHHIHAWSLAGGHPLVTLHARIAPDADGDAVLVALKRELEQRFGLDHSVVQIETASCPDQPEHCA
ncbi:cation diffusion facilitator family transporter [Telmatospirillum sp. J64-1]|uniref:cation diffusion facilitator family transporter n=1 Tax=Telmatospirillum sp. J64-1 TaxID=2502183 RepID=UPI00115D4FB0|nr:cation diffusion facilitator family transporter [Telmatospirillum sp. J64-1]